jgi:hypothetical protein
MVARLKIRAVLLQGETESNMRQQIIFEVASRRRRNGAVPRDRAPPQVNGEQRLQQRDPPKSDSGPRTDPSASVQSPAARQVLLQSRSGRMADRMAIAFRDADVEVELSSHGKTLVAGVVETVLSIDGQSVNPRGDWQAVCRHADDDGDYLELQLCLGDSIRIDRQFLLSRRGRFAVLADAVVATQPGPIEHRLSLPPAAGVEMKSDLTTREARLRTAGCTVRAFPLALPQDRVVSTAGSLCEQSGRLTLTQVGAGRGLFVPLIFDWHPQRRSATAEWRSLTVTEPGKVIGADRAAGYRLRLGKHQVLIYRSLADTGEARAVLGHHTRYETVVGTFDSAGNVAPIVLVEREGN